MRGKKGFEGVSIDVRLDAVPCVLLLALNFRSLPGESQLLAVCGALSGRDFILGCVRGEASSFMGLYSVW